MTEQSFLILASLLDGRLHGYRIIAEVEGLSDGRISLSAGTLYGALDRLQGDGLIKPAGEECVNGRKRRYYELSAAGAAAASAELDRLRSTVSAVEPRLARFRPGAAGAGS